MNTTTILQRGLLIAGLFGVVSAPAAEPVPKVGSLHPFITEMVERISGDALQVEEMVGASADPHAFDPKPRDLLRFQDVDLVLAMGKGLETYLDRVMDNLPEQVALYEVGRKVPSILISDANPLFICCPVHGKGSIDPHWWHDPSGMRRAVRMLEGELSDRFPEHRKAFRANARAYMEELEALDDWARDTLRAVPRNDRKLVTSHAAFGYFCKAYGFRSVPIQGLSREQSPSPAYLGETIRIIREEKITSVFPERDANPKLLETIRAETGAQLGGALLTDNIGDAHITYADFIRHNVKTIVDALQKNREP